MAAYQRQAREWSQLPRAGWSNWELALAPVPMGFEPRGPNQGLIRSGIRNALSLQFGIYEWRAKGTFSHQPNHVVYLGSTCRTKPGTLRQRILEYCTSGSHKSVFINDALGKGYELWVRVKIVEGSRKNAEDMENALLARYDYAWNKRINGQIRYILPWRQHSYELNSRIVTLLFGQS